ncbi:alpha-amylase family glycosyl hydrolase [Halobaculum marinum]|uniref:Alpha-amylase family glycosyl hydrolase n=1 Tax=Halobaculum marinum TaxID=3031996 RepID=A0ABD5X0Z6_9EURY|nr:alpha-amylase family glycosyl hydrolase [Halobaculum sp. DT55]
MDADGDRDEGRATDPARVLADGGQPEWYRDAVVYSLDVKTFQDSDGDGWGDFRGLIDRLDYLEELGVDCLWIRPFYPSPLRDNGYDVADYRDVDSRYGSLDAFDALVDAMDERGMRLITDLVLNHTSTEHEWFQRAREDPDSKYHDYYLWTSHLDDAYHTTNIFPEFEDGVWSYDEVADKHYFHQFYNHQPDLNVANPDVQEELFSIAEFWLERGVDGFRIDAAHPMVLPKGHNAHQMDDPQWLFRELKRRAREVKDDAVLLAEADDEPDKLDFYFAGGEAFDALFNFVGNSHVTYGVGVEDTWPLHRMFEQIPDAQPDGHVWWANFLRNHDEWNLLKLPHEALEHAREFFREGHGDGRDSWIFGRGHRLRLADLYDGDHDRIAMAHSLLLSLPGTPILFSGDEIGMHADLDLPERQAVRTPMRWDDDEPNAGFSSADPEDLVLPVDGTGWPGVFQADAASQRGVDGSLFERVADATDARAESPEVARGEFAVVDTGPKEVWAHRFDHDGTTLVVVHNFADDPREVTVDVDAAADLERVLGAADYRVGDGDVTVALDGCDYLWLRDE